MNLLGRAIRISRRPTATGDQINKGAQKINELDIPGRAVHVSHGRW
jgi:hypothetical protein